METASNDFNVRPVIRSKQCLLVPCSSPEAVINIVEIHKIQNRAQPQPLEIEDSMLMHKQGIPNGEARGDNPCPTSKKMGFRERIRLGIEAAKDPWVADF